VEVSVRQELLVLVRIKNVLILSERIIDLPVCADRAIGMITTGEIAGAAGIMTVLDLRDMSHREIRGLMAVVIVIMIERDRMGALDMMIDDRNKDEGNVKSRNTKFGGVKNGLYTF
jgi:CBS-domain-containing membrane protein